MPATVSIFLIVMFVGFFAMIFGIVYLKTKENLAMVEKGMNPKQQTHRPAPFKSLKLGLLLLGAGLGLLFAFILDANMNLTSGRPGHDVNPSIYFALIAMGGGLGLIASYAVERKYLLDRKDDNQP